MDAAHSVRVAARRTLVPGLVEEIVLEPCGDAPLPAWEAGAHIDVFLPSGLTRQYSLCGLPDAESYTFAVLRDERSRGGSVELHDEVGVGTPLTIRGPRNHFALVDAPHVVLIAGGIGITPLLAMARSLSASGIPWELHYGGRTREAMAYADIVQVIPGGVTKFYPQDEIGPLPLAMIMGAAARPCVVYACGPEGLLVAAEAEAARAGLELHLERFGPSSAPAAPASGNTEFEVTLAQSGCTLPVPAGTRLIDVVREVVPMVPFSCEEGYCGSCETAVLEGVPEHRDTVLSDAERAANDCMMICVGRSRTPILVLDL